MPTSRDDAEALALLTKHARPHGASQWDTPGILSAIAQVHHLDLAEVMKACARAAQDRNLRTPAAIGDVRSSAWRERVADVVTSTRPQICRTHGTQHRGPVCPSCKADELGADGPATPARPARGLPADQVHDVVDELRDHLHTASTSPRETR